MKCIKSKEKGKSLNPGEALNYSRKSFEIPQAQIAFDFSSKLKIAFLNHK